MKKILLFIVCVAGLFSSGSVKAQTFTVADTVWMNVGNGTGTVVEDAITNKTDTNLSIKWIVASTNWPSDWLTSTAFSICDDSTCTSNASGQLWNGTVGIAHKPTYPGSTSHDTIEDYHLLLNFSDVTSSGTYYLTVRMTDVTYGSTGGYSTTTTFVINRWPTAVTNVNNNDNEVVLYPNPTTTDEINLVYSPNADVKNIAVYNVIGKMMSVYKVTDNTGANLRLDNMPSGIYFVRLFNSRGDVVAIRKFTKQ